MFTITNILSYFNNQYFDIIYYKCIHPFIYDIRTYYIMDNYNYPFKVEITHSNVKIYKSITKDTGVNDYTTVPFLILKPLRVFIGKSPLNKMTKFSGGYGTDFDGNSILIKLNDNKYIYIGDNIFEFTPLSPIKKYISHVGNNCVPYPYAVDENDNYYLMLENVIVSNIPIKNIDNPYKYYYNKGLITPDIGIVPPREPVIKYFNNIIAWFIGDNQYTMRYTPFPHSEYERHASYDDFGDGMKIKYIDETTKIITKSDYVNIHNIFGNLVGFKPFITKELHKRHNHWMN